ncbi:MAG: FHA domain-containing protein [Actinomycetota bacterium]
MTILGVLELLGTPSSTGGRRWEIHHATVVGRSGEADITINIAALSRAHAELFPLRGRVAVRDLGSRNGSARNGEPVGSEPVMLDDGDEIVLAGEVAFRFIDPMATPIRPRIGRLTGVWIDPETETVWLDARLIEPPLSPRQLALLRLLDECRGEVVTRTQIVSAVWPDVESAGVSDEAVAGLTKRLRQRLAELGRDDLIEAVRHRGLRLVDP